MAKQRKLTDQEIQQNKTDRLMWTIAKRCAYYRANPSRFIQDFIPGLNLKWFQKILLWAMAKYDAFLFLAARSLGKTFLVGLFAVHRCILYPGSKIIACASTFKQGKEIVGKITDDFMQRSSLIRNEISKVSVSQNDCAVYFKNGSFIKVVTSTENSRGARSNVLIVDEARMVDQKIVDTVLRPMNGSPRQPGYLRKPEYAHLKEMNKEMYMSSAWFSASQLFEKAKAFTANMLDPSLSYFICDLPYTLSIREGLLLKQQIINEMSEATFSDISFAMERRGLFWGSAADALFDYKTLNDRRIVVESLRPLEYYRLNNLRVPEKQKGEIRVLSVDVALLASKRHDNDASSIQIHSGIPTSSHQYMDNIIYIDSQEGQTTEDLGLLIMRDYYQYGCDYIGLDSAGIGQAVLDYLMADRYDPMYGQVYGALNVCNNDDFVDRCKVKGAPKVIYAIKANAKFNNDMYISLRAGFQNGNINLLINDNNVEDKMSSVRGYGKMTDVQKMEMQAPYVHTTLLVNEFINLTYENNNGLIKVREHSGMRKDRTSSCGYGYYVILELSKNLKPRSASDDILSKFVIRKPRY